MVPAITDLVLFFHQGATEPVPKPHAAIITHVYSDTVVDLEIFGGTGKWVESKVPYSKTPTQNTWSWPA